MTTKNHNNKNQAEHSDKINEAGNLAGIGRQLVALFYDVWLLAAVFLVASALTLPFTDGEPVKPGNPFMTSYVFFVWYGFYAWFWTHGGQTLGMRSWKIRLIAKDSRPLNLWHALLRFISGIPAWALIGIGSYLLLADNPDLQHPVINALSKLPPIIILAIGSLLLLSGYMKNSWREKVSSTSVIITKAK